MENVKEKQELGASVEYRKRFILEEIEKMDEKNISFIFALMLGRMGKAYLASSEVR